MPTKIVRRFAELLIITVVCFCGSALGQQQFDRILLPLSTDHVRGAFGSEWVTDLAVTNVSDIPLTVIGYDRPICPVMCAAEPIPPRNTIFPSAPRSCPAIAGRFLLVERGRSGDVAVTLRAHDVSRQNETWGTVIPAVLEKDLFGTRFGLVDIPLDAQFRTLVRIYDFNPVTGAAVRVRVYAVDPMRAAPDLSKPDPDRLLLELTPRFVTPDADPFGFCSGYAEVALSGQPVLADTNRVRVEIEPLTNAKDYWAFASVTHNETQHVTVITPQ